MLLSGPAAVAKGSQLHRALQQLQSRMRLQPGAAERRLPCVSIGTEPAGGCSGCSGRRCSRHTSALQSQGLEKTCKITESNH